METRQKNGRFAKGVHAYRQPRPHWDKTWLHQQYVDLGRSSGDIGKEIGVTDAAILFWLKRHNIARRTVAGARKIKKWGVSGPANPMFGRTGPLNPRYVDGSSPERQRLYAMSIGKDFKSQVLIRDSFCCVRCGKGRIGPRSLHVHHIKSWAGNPDTRADPDNAVTLCRGCHSWVHSRANIAQEYLK